MATAAKSISVGPAGVEPGQIPPPGTAEMFAAMIAGVGGDQASGEGAPSEAVPEDIGDNVETEVDASVLLPMLDQQRAATPAAKLVGPAVERSSPATVKVAPASGPLPAEAAPAIPADPIPVAERIDGKGATVAPAAPANDPVTDAIPVMRPLPGGKAAPGTVVDAAPVMRPLSDGKTAPVADKNQVMRPIDAGKPVPAAINDAAPIVRPTDASKAVPAAVDGAAPVARPADASKAVPAAIDDAAPVVRPTDASKPVPAAVDGGAPVVRPADASKAVPAAVDGAAPVVRPAHASKTVPAAIDDAAPALRPSDAGKAVPAAVNGPAPVMRQIAAGKPVPISSTDPAPIMRPIGAPTGKNVQPAVPVEKGGTPAAIDAPQPEVQTLAPKVEAPPSVKPDAGNKVAGPEAQIAVADAQAAPVTAKARASRTSVAPVTVETAKETPAATQVTATATETRAAAQPLHAAPSPVQPLAAPAGAPVQTVGAALSQQVLDMSGGDAWIDQIARDISQTAGKDGAMRFRLAPETLGELKVEITQSERGAHVRLNVSSEGAQQALAAAEHKLAAEARAQGVRIAETEINFTGGQSRDASSFAREQGQQAQQQAQANQQPRMSRGTSANSFTSSATAPEGRGRTDRYA